MGLAKIWTIFFNLPPALSSRRITNPDAPANDHCIRVQVSGQDRWAIYWINSKDGQLQPPVYGRFENGRGVFAGDDFDDGKPVKVLFDWSGTDTETPRWSQAFSYDDGTTWETNWIMEFRRPAR